MLVFLFAVVRLSTVPSPVELARCDADEAAEWNLGCRGRRALTLAVTLPNKIQCNTISEE